jgi:hypothetical protein
MISGRSLLLLWGLLLSQSSISKTVTADHEYPLIQSIAADLAYDEHNRLSQHHLVFDATSDSCQVMSSNFRHVLDRDMDTADRFRLVGVEGHALDRVFGTYPKSEDLSCRAACVERGTERAYAGYVMPDAVYNSHSSKGNFADWFEENCRKIEVCVLSYHSKKNSVDVYWKRPDGSLSLHKTIQYGEQHTSCFKSFLGHQFVAKDSVTQEFIGDLTVEYITVKAFGESPPSSTRKDSHDFVKEIEDTLRYEWNRHKRISRTFSPLGFKKGRLPPDVFASMGAFYYNNAQSVVREEWDNKGVFVNWWETDVLFVQIPWALKGIYQGRLRAMVEEWAGEPVEQTVMYGLRMYTEGARLLSHVDRHSTHAVSLIVNVAQGNLTDPWPVEVQDHADRMHEVLMEPGDVVFYESAKCLHARNRPMKGRNAYYVNLFTHYRPVNDPEWFQKPNPKGTPEPVLGTLPLREECQLVRKGLTATGPDSHSVGYVEGVECQNPLLGPYISPALFQVSGPEDMIEWWRSTGEGYQEPEIRKGSTTETTSSNEL